MIGKKIFLRFYLFIHIHRERERERGRDTGRRGSRLHAGSPDVGLDPGSPGSHPRLQAAPNRCATRAAQNDRKIDSKLVWRKRLCEGIFQNELRVLECLCPV